MDVENFDLLVGVIDRELDRKRAADVDRHLPPDGIVLDVFSAMSGKSRISTSRSRIARRSVFKSPSTNTTTS